MVKLQVEQQMCVLSVICAKLAGTQHVAINYTEYTEWPLTSSQYGYYHKDLRRHYLDNEGRKDENPPSHFPEAELPSRHVISAIQQLDILSPHWPHRGYVEASPLCSCTSGKILSCKDHQDM